VYLGYVIGWGELKIDHAKMEAIMKWPIPKNVTEVRSFVRVEKYLQKFITSFSIVATSLHAITTCGKSFQWGNNQHKDFDELKIKINQALVLTLPNL
jgi:alpha-tubulin suppressor-like RCC1 family protein